MMATSTLKISTSISTRKHRHLSRSSRTHNSSYLSFRFLGPGDSQNHLDVSRKRREPRKRNVYISALHPVSLRDPRLWWYEMDNLAMSVLCLRRRAGYFEGFENLTSMMAFSSISTAEHIANNSTAIFPTHTHILYTLEILDSSTIQTLPRVVKEREREGRKENIFIPAPIPSYSAEA